MQLSSNDLSQSARLLHERFDFDHWKKLHETDPEQFEMTRRQCLDQLIADTSQRNKARMRGLIFQIDCIRERSKNPTKSCLDLLDMMWSSFYRLQQLVNDIGTSPQTSINPSPKAPAESAKLLEFRQH